MYWEANTTKRRPGRLRNNWIDAMRKDLNDIGMSWEEAQEHCAYREDWNCWLGLLRVQRASLVYLFSCTECSGGNITDASFAEKGAVMEGSVVKVMDFQMGSHQA